MAQAKSKCLLAGVAVLVGVAAVFIRPSSEPRADGYRFIDRAALEQFIDRHYARLQKLDFFPKAPADFYLKNFHERSPGEFKDLVIKVREQEKRLLEMFPGRYSSKIFDAYILERQGARRGIYFVSSHYNPLFLYQSIMSDLAARFPHHTLVLIHNKKNLTQGVSGSIEEAHGLFASGVFEMEEKNPGLAALKKDIFVVCQGFQLAYGYLSAHADRYDKAILFTPKAMNRKPGYALPDQIFPPGQEYMSYAEISIYYDMQEGKGMPISYPYPEEFERLSLKTERAMEKAFEKGLDVAKIPHRYLIYPRNTKLVPPENSMAEKFASKNTGILEAGAHLDSLLIKGEARDQLLLLLERFGVSGQPGR